MVETRFIASPTKSSGGLFIYRVSHKGGIALAAWRGEACEAPSEAKPVRERPL
jgi:hypothetical protein